MPPVAAAVVQKCGDPDTDVKSLAELISRDAALTVRVLRIANSGFYSMRREIESVQQSIVLLGFSSLRSLVVAAALKDVFARFGLAERLLWDHAVAGGIAAAMLATRVGGFSPSDVFVGGLIHDVGKLLMHANAEARYQEVTRAVYAGESDAVSAEMEIFGFDHALVGALLLEKWELPGRLARAVRGHHDPESSDDEARPLAALLQLADLLCLQQGLGRRKPDAELNPLDSAGARILGLEGLDPDELAASFKTAYAEEKGLFS